jgi:tetratricopeptide (TPR) repeat protein
VRAPVELRGGRSILIQDNSCIFCFDAQDTEDARRVLDAACDVGDVLAQRRDQLTGFLLVVEYFPETVSRDSACHELRGIIFTREIDDSILLGPEGAGFFRPYCTVENAGSCFRITGRIKKPAAAPDAAGEFFRRVKVVGALRTKISGYLDCKKPPQIFFVYGPALSGIRYQVNAALEEILGSSPMCRIYPLPGQCLPGFDFPGFERIPSVLTAAEKTLWKEKKAVFTARNIMDFPFEEAVSAYFLATAAYIRLCENALSPAVFLCEEFHALPETGKRILALLFRRNLPGWRLLPVCMSQNSDPGKEFKNIPCEKYAIPPVDAGDVKALISAFSGKQALSRLVSVRSSSGGIQALYFEFLAGSRDAGKTEPFREFQAAIHFLIKQEGPLREILWVIQEAAGLLSSRRLEIFLRNLDIPRGQYNAILKQLVSLGFIRDEKSLVPLFPELLRFLRKDTALRREKIIGDLAEFFYGEWKEKRMAGEPVLINFFAETRKNSWLTEVFHEYIQSLLDAGNIAEAQRLLKTKFPLPLTSDMKLALASAGIRISFALENKENAGEIFAQPETAWAGNPYYGSGLIQKTLYGLKRGSRKEALDCAKNAVMTFQENPQTDSLARAHTVVGLTILAGDNPEEAIDYFLMARESETGSMRGIFFEGICRLIMGSLSQALGNFTYVAELADARFSRRWAIAARFQRGRIFFELGEYGEAGRIFQTLLAETASLRYAKPVPVLYAWLARCLLYLGDIKMAVRILDKCGPGQEAGFFRTEADFFRKDYKKARERLETFADIPYEGESFLGDEFAWKDGFYFTENLCIGSRQGVFFLPNLIRFFHAYLRGLDAEHAGIEIMSRLIRDEKTSKNDPCLGIYYYWYSRLLPEGENPAFEDRLTVLGRAVRNLESRASRMDNPAHKRAFTGKNYWNRLLMEDARQYNLV